MTASGHVETAEIEDPPNDWRSWERFTVFDAAGGLIALYNVEHRRFLRTVAAAYDAHFVAAPNRHAKAV